MPRQLIDNFEVALTTAISSTTATSIALPTGVGAQLASLTLTAANFLPLVITNGTDVEVVHATGRSTDTLTVVRGREGTSGLAFPVGALIGCYPTAAAFAEIRQDGWTYVKLASDFTNSSTTAANSPLAFTPAANTDYEIEGMLYLESAATTTGVQPGIVWPTSGITRNIGRISSSGTATAESLRNWGGTTTQRAAATAVVAANVSQYGDVRAAMVMGSSPVGDFIISLASEIAASQVALKAGSFIRYRIVA